MTTALALQHLETFARVRNAGAADLPHLIRLETAIAGAQSADWAALMANRCVDVIVAVECDVLVGAVAGRHEAMSSIAELSWLGVDRSARRRGVGRLLLEQYVSVVRSQGAAALRTTTREPAVHGLLADIGFRPALDNASELELSLWLPGRQLRQASVEIRHFPASGRADPAVCTLLMAMSSLDPRILVTPRVESVVGHEVAASTTGRTVAVAEAAARRGFDVELYGAGPQFRQPSRRPLGAGHVVNFNHLPQPEQLAGYLTRRQVVILHGALPRLHGAEPHWLVLADFDGFLFRLVDPTRDPGHREAVSADELRVLLAAPTAECLVIHR